jgi:hypothetical protein
LENDTGAGADDVWNEMMMQLVAGIADHECDVDHGQHDAGVDDGGESAGVVAAGDAYDDYGSCRWMLVVRFCERSRMMILVAPY